MTFAAAMAMRGRTLANGFLGGGESEICLELESFLFVLHGSA